MTRIADLLPKLYAELLPEFFQSELPANKAANCGECPMLSAPHDHGPKDRFSPATKCCTYYPNLPNFLVGAVLSSRAKVQTAGRERIRRIIRSGSGVVPAGVFRPAKWSLLMRHSRQAFGKAESLRCPLFDASHGRCTIAPFWHSVCRTWFCKYDAGEDGRLFWAALRAFWSLLEDRLVQYVLREEGWEAEAVLAAPTHTDNLEAEDADEKRPPNYRQLWGKWGGREEAFYKRAFRRVSRMTRKDCAQLLSVTDELHLDVVKQRYDRLVRPVLPARLMRNSSMVAGNTGDGYIVTGYSSLDPVEISDRVGTVLEFFDGRQSTADTIETVKQVTGYEPTEDLLLSLYRFRILVEP